MNGRLAAYLCVYSKMAFLIIKNPSFLKNHLKLEETI